MNYCPAGTDLCGFVKTYVSKGGDDKGYFPYEWFTSFGKLECLISDLEIEDFNSKFKNSVMSEDDFNSLMETCKSLGLTTVKDLLEWYNNSDVGPMLRACLK